MSPNGCDENPSGLLIACSGILKILLEKFTGEGNMMWWVCVEIFPSPVCFEERISHIAERWQKIVGLKNVGAPVNPVLFEVGRGLE